METSRAFIALSGGVDSTVAAYLTLQQGIPCVGGTLRLYDGDDATCRRTCWMLRTWQKSLGSAST